MAHHTGNSEMDSLLLGDASGAHALTRIVDPVEDILRDDVAGTDDADSDGDRRAVAPQPPARRGEHLLRPGKESANSHTSLRPGSHSVSGRGCSGLSNLDVWAPPAQLKRELEKPGAVGSKPPPRAARTSVPATAWLVGPPAGLDYRLIAGGLSPKLLIQTSESRGKTTHFPPPRRDGTARIYSRRLCRPRVCTGRGPRYDLIRSPSQPRDDQKENVTPSLSSATLQSRELTCPFSQPFSIPSSSTASSRLSSPRPVRSSTSPFPTSRMSSSRP